MIYAGICKLPGSRSRSERPSRKPNGVRRPVTPPTPIAQAGWARRASIIQGLSDTVEGDGFDLSRQGKGLVWRSLSWRSDFVRWVDELVVTGCSSCGCARNEAVVQAAHW